VDHNLDNMNMEIQQLIDKYSWHIKYNSDNELEALEIYLQAKKLSKKLKIDLYDFWFRFLN